MTQEELREYRSLYKEVEELRRMLLEMEARQGTDRWTELSGTVYAARKERFEEAQHRASLLLERIETSIEDLPSMERRVIRLRYIEGFDWFRVSSMMNFSYDHVSGKLHRNALRLLKENKREQAKNK